MHRRFLALALAGVAASAAAQLSEDPDWKEAEAPPPPALRTEGLVPLDVASTSLRFGIDPASITIGRDRVVRYVVVATGSGGAVNAMYEGIRCNTAEVKTYARYRPGSGWNALPNAEWQKLQDTAALRHSVAFARAGGCRERAPNISPAQVVLDLQSTPNFRREAPGVR